MRTGVPCNENRFFPVRICYTGKTLLWPCTGPVRDCSVVWKCQMGCRYYHLTYWVGYLLYFPSSLLHLAWWVEVISGWYHWFFKNHQKLPWPVSGRFLNDLSLWDNTVVMTMTFQNQVWSFRQSYWQNTITSFEYNVDFFGRNEYS